MKLNIQLNILFYNTEKCSTLQEYLMMKLIIQLIQSYYLIITSVL